MNIFSRLFAPTTPTVEVEAPVVPSEGIRQARVAADKRKLEAQLSRKEQETQRVIEQIHNSFNTASDRILEEAKRILATSSTVEVEKANRLQRLGFGNAQGVAEAKQAASDARAAKTIQELLLEYRMKYPTYKFITKDEIDKICQKYGLVMGDISAYKGFVPDKNLREIENWKGMKDEDAIVKVTTSYGMGLDHSSEVTKKEWIKMSTPKQRTSGIDSPDGYKVHFMGDDRRVTERTYASPIGYKICAPLKDMNVSSRERVVGNEIVAVPDPIVLQKVRGDLYAIITAWGDEASDPLVINPINN